MKQEICKKKVRETETTDGGRFGTFTLPNKVDIENDRVNMNALRVVALLALTLAFGACRHTHVAAQVRSIDWHTSPMDLNLRGMNGKSYLFSCPVGKPVPESVTGSGIYTDASSICAAAAHAGAIDAQHGGRVMIQILPGQSDYRGSTQNFIRSVTYPHAWGGSFAILSVTDSSGGKKT